MRARYGKLKNMKSGQVAPEFTEREQHMFTAFQFLDRNIKIVGSHQFAKVCRPQHKNEHFTQIKRHELMTMFQLTYTTCTIYLFTHPQQDWAISMYYVSFIPTIDVVP